jgi:hypothetical protein
METNKLSRLTEAPRRQRSFIVTRKRDRVIRKKMREGEFE